MELVRGCCHEFLRGYPFDGTELVYSDPPHLHSARKSSRRYRHDYSEEDHDELLGLLRGLPCAVMVSGYPSSFYDGRLPGWRSASVQVANQAGAVTEKVWFNFEPDRVPRPRARRAHLAPRHRTSISTAFVNAARLRHAPPQFTP